MSAKNYLLIDGILLGRLQPDQKDLSYEYALLTFNQIPQDKSYIVYTHTLYMHTHKVYNGLFMTQFWFSYKLLRQWRQYGKQGSEALSV